MTPDRITRRDLVVSLTTATAGLGISRMAFAAPAAPVASDPVEGDGISHASDAIHQEVVLNASRRRIYGALTDTGQFDRITRLSDAVALVTAPGATPTEIGRDVGGSFVLFGGYITGRQIELVPDERLVQVWRAASWSPGEYSLVKFALVDQGSRTRLVFEHKGFPKGTAVHLAQGWHSHYWEPLSKFLAQEGQ